MKKVFTIATAVLFAVAMIACNKAPQPHEHTFESTWSQSATHHWHAANCGHPDEKQDYEAHTFVDGKCNACQYEQPHEHTYESTWSQNATHHWHAANCGHPDEKQDYEAHTFVDGKCNVCQYEQPHEHAFEEAWSHDETHHWHAASCGHPDEKQDYEEHTFVEGDCKCGYSISLLSYTASKLNGDIIAYVVRGFADEETDRTTLVVPALHEGKPVTRIAYEAFSRSLYQVNRDPTLKKVTIGENVEIIEVGAFGHQPDLTEVSLPASLRTIGAGAFAGCDALETVSYAGTVSDWASIEQGNDMLMKSIHVSSAKFLLAGEELPETLVIENVRTIGTSAFEYTPVKTVVLKNVKKVSEDAFVDCPQLATIVLGKEIELFVHAFKGRSSDIPHRTVFFEGDAEAWKKVTTPLPGGFEDIELWLFREERPSEEGNFWHWNEDRTAALKWE